MGIAKKMEKIAEKKKIFAELKEKAGKAFLEANSVKGGVLDSCHQVECPIDIEI